MAVLDVAATVVSIVARVMEAVMDFIDEAGKDLDPAELQLLRVQVLQGIQDRAQRIAEVKAEQWRVARGETPPGK